MLALGETGPASTVCFRAQQCVEKYLKALLTYLGISFPKTHDLVLLYNRLGGEPRLNVRVEDLQPLNRYAVEARYPGDWEPIGYPAAQEAVAVARRIREVIRRMLPCAAQ